MRYSLLLVCVFAFHQSNSQQRCIQHSILYRFDPKSSPRNFTERLGNHPQFPFLQQENGVNTSELFIAAIQDSGNRLKYKRAFEAFDLLLHNSGFKNGYKDLSLANVKNVFIAPGTIGNLGFYNPQQDRMSYIYVALNPAGEGPKGVAAWKLTNRSGCFLYILHTCGNAFYPNTGGSPHGENGAYSGDCCRTLSVDAGVDTVEWNSGVTERPMHVQVNFYEAILVPKPAKSGAGHNRFDTVVRLIRHVDTTGFLSDGAARQWKVYGLELTDKLMLCRDSSLKLFTRLLVDSSGPAANAGDLSFTVSDTNYNRRLVSSAAPACSKKWEIAADGGLSVNTIPRLNAFFTHTQTNGAHLAGELAISRIFNHWFQAGVSASVVMLSYQDDIGYPGSVVGIYNSVYLGNPIIPVQLFGKATFGGPLGWQANFSLSAGFSIPTNGTIQSSGTVLTTKPALQGGPTAGVKFGLAYFFSCKFGLALSAGGQYFSNKGALASYSLWALPVLAGIRYRF